MDSLTIYKQWKTIHVPANRKGSKNDEDEEPKFYQKLHIISEEVTVGGVMKIFSSSLQELLLMIILNEFILMHSKTTSMMSTPKSCKQIMQWPINVSNKVKSKVH